MHDTFEYARLHIRAVSSFYSLAYLNVTCRATNSMGENLHSCSVWVAWDINLRSSLSSHTFFMALWMVWIDNKGWLDIIASQLRYLLQKLLLMKSSILYIDGTLMASFVKRYRRADMYVN